MQNLLGVVMCGGQSQRMGTDKGLIKQGDKTWAQLIFNKLQEQNIPVVVSVNQTQISAYSTIFSIDDLIVDNQNIPGPLNGILSVHAIHPDKHILILACDMIDMDNATLQKLIDTYQTLSTHNYYAYHNTKFFEPLCAIYTAQELTALKETDLSNYTLQRILKIGNTSILQITNPEAFTNRNTKP